MIGNFGGIALSLLAAFLSVIGFAVSPTLLLAFAGFFSTAMPDSATVDQTGASVASAQGDLPPAIKDLKITELAEFTASILPPEGTIPNWSYLSDNSKIIWQTDGVIYEGNSTAREGLVRIRIEGKASTALHKTLQELPWSIRLETEGPQKFGPTFISIQPGYKFDVCFGSLYEGCMFTSEQVLSGSNLKHELICQRTRGVEKLEAYVVSAPRKKESLLVYRASGGSGGMSAWLEIRPLSDQPEVCQSVQN